MMVSTRNCLNVPFFAEGKKKSLSDTERELEEVNKSSEN